MAGGALRRKMIGTHSKEGLIGELKLTCSEDEIAWLTQEIEGKVEAYRGKYKDHPEVEVSPGVMYYPKDGSFSFKEKAVAD
jgi:hypothetical protein